MNSHQHRRDFVRVLGSAALAASVPAALVRAQTSDPIRIGYAISKTGPFAGGAASAQIPNYKLWVDDVNKAGGIAVGAGKRRVEVIEYDDRSQPEEAVRAIERLVNQDKVDFLLPPWGTGMNLAVAPTFHKGNFPMIMPSCITDRMPELVKRWDNMFSLLTTASSYSDAVVAVMSQMRAEGKIGSKVAMVNVTDQFGLELAAAARKSLKAAKFELVLDSSYPITSQDMTPLIADAQRTNPDIFLGFSYPPDTLGLTESARVRGFNPKVFYAGVGTALPLYAQKFGANTEGVMGPGGWNPDTEALKAYAARHTALAGQPPEQWVSALCYSGLQALQQAIEKVGKIDRPAIVKTLGSMTFDTVAGPLKFDNHILAGGWTVGQWQGGTFFGIAPKQKGAKAPVAKPAWKAA
ncbi:amino acid ABC transporter substrate-binding protein [Variovorax sp. NFACC27]|uniref:amino acid ABC transporter substrate-binding protein n=1 Tax=unclassified Variovorax TaxID=663243 RepID=UPI00089A4A71|nr:branched-chain amino acid transport system substrate-binding protein [Variovorax sp. NFACC28]SEG98160.1 branched-chain amino acid transport system substrate-binding protein [Variovorax sp. NFACC29]SFE05100.1 branched-chain amino acid transport system substrate-binding protein [Variovorax sp. NFACC26]SFH13059.1 branched-chain amino acid transport system substrate-binding protein [Variovorax sp. NFACC27]